MEGGRIYDTYQYILYLKKIIKKYGLRTRSHNIEGTK